MLIMQLAGAPTARSRCESFCGKGWWWLDGGGGAGVGVVELILGVRGSAHI